MEIILSQTSSKPIYEQIVLQIKAMIMNGQLKPQTPLPSMRKLAKDLHVSIITTQRAYDELSKDGFIILRGSDDGSIVSTGDNGLIEKVIQMHLQADGISDRFNGRKLYGQLIASGYKNVKMMSCIKETSSLDIDEKEDIFLERFEYRKTYLQNALEKDPYNMDKKNALDAMCYALDMLENIFSEESFWYSEIDFVAVGKRV